MEEQEEGGVSLGDIFHTIFSQKWLALILVVAITLAGTLGLYFYGKSTRVYTVKYILQLPDADHSPASYVYPDGSNFYYTDLVSAYNLAKIKNSNDEYANIDIENMVKKGDISITRDVTETNTTTGKTEASYSVSAKSKYFANKDIARSFLTDITQIPSNYIASMNISYDMYLTAAREAITFDIEFDFLENQVNYLKEVYDTYIETYGSNFVIDNGKTLLSYRSDLDVFILNGSISNHRTEARAKCRIKSEASISKYETDVEELNRQCEIEKQTLSILMGTNDDGSSSSSSIITTVGEVLSQAKLVSDLEDQIRAYNEYLVNGNIDDDFAQSVIDMENDVAEITQDFAKVSKALFVNSTSASFNDVNIISMQSKIGLIMSFAISFIASLIIAAIVAYIVGYSKNKKAAGSVKAEAPLPQEKSEIAKEDK